jgi:hypothetical protein
MSNGSKFGRAGLIIFDRERRRASTDSPITAELKGFIDRVVVPFLVQSYLAELPSEKQIAETATTVASCEFMADAPQAEVAR